MSSVEPPVPNKGNSKGALVRAVKRYVAATPGLTLTGALRQAGISSGRSYWINRAGEKLTFKTAAEIALAIGAPIGQFLEAVAWEMGLHPQPTPPRVLCRLPLGPSGRPGRPRKAGRQRAHNGSDRHARVLKGSDLIELTFARDPAKVRGKPSDFESLDRG